MTEKEVVRLKVAERLIEKVMKVEEAAHILNSSTKQAIRINLDMVVYKHLQLLALIPILFPHGWLAIATLSVLQPLSMT